MLPAGLISPANGLKISDNTLVVTDEDTTSNRRRTSVVGYDGVCRMTIDGASGPMCLIPGDNMPMKCMLMTVDRVVVVFNPTKFLVAKITSFDTTVDERPSLCVDRGGKSLFIAHGNRLQIFEL